MSQYPNQPPYQQGPGGQPPYQPGPGGPPYQPQPGGYQPQPPYQPGPGGQPPYQPQPGGQPPYQPGYQPPAAAAQAVAKMAAPAPTVNNADVFERVTSLLVYGWIIAFGFKTFLNFRLYNLTDGLPSGASLGNLRGLSSSTTQFSFNWSLDGLLGIIGPLAVMMAIKKGDLIVYHARQAFFLALAYVVLRAAVQVLYLIPVVGIQDVLLDGIIVPIVNLGVAFLAVFTGIRAFYNKELYAIPVISGFAGRKPTAPPAYGGPR